MYHAVMGSDHETAKHTQHRFQQEPEDPVVQIWELWSEDIYRKDWYISALSSVPV